ncbi:hypothetical protein PQX77_015541 [Marasmius sp. AFHP31]|nr:hypothetical protein PQX77_015541 [Marasmius sp. AFHP31]
MSHFFANAQNLSINGGTFSGVNGDQHNHYYERTLQASHLSTSRSGSVTQGTSSRAITTTIHINGNQINNQIVEREEKELTEFDDYRNLKRGDICRLRDICQILTPCKCDAWVWGSFRRRRRVMKMICAAKVNGVEGEFTVVSYTGPDARKVFEEEFHKLSRQLFSEVAQVYAIDKGTIPSMVLWHNLVPLAQLLGNVGYLGRTYLNSLHNQWDCDLGEIWMDPTRGVVCRGPKGPRSYYFIWDEFEIKDLPPNAELLQGEVLVRFLGNQRSREVDDAFMNVMLFLRESESIPERVNRPTIFSALTKTPIAVANNIWKSSEDNLVERTCLENGWTRFRLDGDGRLELGLNGDIKEAWLWQATSVFHARGVSLEDDLEDFHLVYPWRWLDGNLDDSPSRCQLRQQQPIFLFIYPPPPNIPDGETSSLHHWSFQEDGHSQISPKSCFHLGLPVELDYENLGFESCSWITDCYKCLHQYQIARGFDPTTADFVQHLGHPVFVPLNDSDRFEDVQKDQTSPSPSTSADHGGSLIIVDTEYPSDIPDPIRAEDVASVGDPQDRGGECYKSSYHNLPNKRQKTDFDCGGIENRNHPHQVHLYHKVDLASDEKVMMDADWRPIQPLPARNLPFAGTNPTYYVHQSTSTSQVHPLHHSSPNNQVFCRHPSLSSRDVLSPYDSTASTASISDQFSLPTHTVERPLNMSHTTEFNSFDMTPPFGSYNNSNATQFITESRVVNGIYSPCSNPSAYSVITIPTEYDTNSVQDLGWSDNSGHERAYRYNPPLNVFSDNTSNHSSV